nr:ankyrin repeat domain-containing protein 17-like [Hydra vulgaris]
MFKTSVNEMLEQQNNHPNTPDSSDASDSESPSSETESILHSVSEPDVSLDEMLSLACRQGKLDIVQLLLQSGAHVNHRNKAGNTPLLEACSQGHVNVANYLLENGSKIDTPTEATLDSALTWACTLGNTNIVNALLYKKADVEHRTKDGCTALMFACLAGHREVAEKLLDANSEINVESASNKDSPLTFACWKGHVDVVELLLKRNANIEHRTKEGFSPLMFAALGGHTKVARKLLEHKAQVNIPSGSNNDIPLTSACWKGHTEVVKLLLEFASNIEHRTKDGCTPLMLAAREGHLCVAELLLGNNAQVNVPSGSENNIPLTLACWKGHLGVVRLLLDYGSDIEHRNKAGCTPLMLAAREGHLETTALLLERNAEVNVPSGSNDDTPLTLACWKGHKEVVLLLLEHKSNIDHQTKTGCTPLMEATREGHRHVAEILLNHNADVELPDNYGQSPLFMACWKGHHDVAELLLSRGAYRDCRTKTGITPLFQACRENHVSIVELLLSYGAGINSPFPNSRENPMTLCAEKGHKELVKLFLSKGASQDCRTKKGCTPAFLACKEGHIEIAQMLSNHYANLETPDCRGNTPIMSAFKNGHVAIVEWLIKFVHHLPSDEICHKILMSAVEEKEKEVIVQRRSKCLAIIQETKRKRELLALKNAQNLVQELDEERTREEKKKEKIAAKRRDKRNKRKKNREIEDQVPKVNGLINHDDDDENDDEEIKDNIMPTENRFNSPEEDFSSVSTVQKTSEVSISTLKVEMKTSRKKSRRKSTLKKAVLPCLLNHEAKVENYEKLSENSESSKTPLCSSSVIDVHVLANQLSEDARIMSETLTVQKCSLDINRQRPKTSGVCTQSTSTLGPSRSAVSCQTEKKSVTTAIGTPSKLLSHFPIVSSVAMSTCTQSITTQSDPRTHVYNITPFPKLESWDSESIEHSNEKEYKSRSGSDSASLSRNNSFDEYRESDWREVSRTHKLLIYDLTVPNGYCGRVIGKGGKKINLITEESGAQITIDKPTVNNVPADRIITIKGNHTSSDKARYLVTRALNTPSLAARGVVMYDSTYSKKTDIKPTPSMILSREPVKEKKIKEARPRLSSSERPTSVSDTSTASLTCFAKVSASGPTYSKVATKTIYSEIKDTSETQTSTVNSVVNGNLNSHQECSQSSKELEPTRKSSNFASMEFSYFSQVNKVNENSETDQKIPQSVSTFSDSKLSFGSTWHSTAAKSEEDNRMRSITWNGKLMSSPLSVATQESNHNISSESVKEQCIISPLNNIQQLSDGFSDEQTWMFTKRKDDIQDRWEVSSPQSSVSSSKMELTSILDNENSSARSLDFVTASVSIGKVFDNTPWLQSRGAYSAPSSPSLLHTSCDGNLRNCIPKQATRFHTSVEELNRPWLDKVNPECNTWNTDLSNPMHCSNSIQQSMDNTILNDKILTLENTQPNEDQSSSLITAPWSAERLQNIHSLNELLVHLSLEKYTTKFESHGITFETLLTLSEKELANLSVPKGPRLKILKARNVIQDQRRLASGVSPMITPSIASFQSSYTPNTIVKSQYSQQLPDKSDMKPYQPIYTNGNFQYPEFLPYGPTFPPQIPPGYNTMLPSNQHFMHPTHTQNLPVYTATGEEFSQQISLEHSPHHNMQFISQGYMYPNHAFYFYSPQT